MATLAPVRSAFNPNIPQNFAELGTPESLVLDLVLRRMLIEGGVAASKLRTSYASADYIASNSTAAGRAQNRRVDLVFVGKASEPIHGVLNESSTEAPRLADALARATTPTLKFADR